MFKHLSKTQKIVGVLALGGIIYYFYQKNQAKKTPTVAAAPATTDATAASADGFAGDKHQRGYVNGMGYRDTLMNQAKFNAKRGHGIQ